MKLKLLTVPRPAPAAAAVRLIEWQGQLYHETRSAPRPLRELTPRLLERRNLEAAWERVSSAEGAETPGPDGVRCGDLRQRLPAWLAALADDLFHGRYEPRPPRWIEVPKPGRPGQVRRIGLLNIRDRVVQAALKQLLEPLLDPLFLPCSYGFRPGHSVAGALAEAVRRLDGPAGHAAPFARAVHLDVADCFDTVDHGLLLEELRRLLADADLLRLLEGVLLAGGTRTGRLWWKRTCGLVQGSSLSPLLCNLALHPLDVALRDLAATTQQGFAALRYADDLLLLARDAALAERGVALVRQSLGRRHQRLRDDRPPVVALEAGIEWLGVRLQPRRRHWPGQRAFGYVVPDGRVADMLARLTEMTLPPSSKIDGSAFIPARWIVSINDQLRDWRQVYLHADNAPELFRTLDEFAEERVGALLQSLTGLGRYELLRRHRVRLPRAFTTWEVPGARLSVLSSLAPQAPVVRTRKPDWMRRRPPTPAAPPAPGAIQEPPHHPEGKKEAL